MMRLPDMKPEESEAEYVATLRAAGATRSVAARQAQKQVLLRSLNDHITHAELVRLVRRIVNFL